ncbi:MAG: nickel pincer cofactor biosynthesis protein LarB [Candidatus Omnitrophica bacterium]|nr:nickel pincer cofactor biosynthesis protein LarB [Candidatus Omnitrophota bacterium]
MDRKKLEKLLNDVSTGKVSPEKAMKALKKMPFDDIGFAKIDTHRDLRKGFPEVIFCRGKTVKQIAEIVKKHGPSACVMATRADKKMFREVKKVRGDSVFHEEAGIIVSGKGREKAGKVTVISAGTSDIPVAEEAAVTAETIGVKVDRIYDVGVAGLHRLIAHHDRMVNADALVVAAGMEGALASVVGGITGSPVIAVPTSIGYGASFEGIAPLLTMLNSCAPGVTVVNIDNGFGAGYFAALIVRRKHEDQKGKA